MAIFTITSEEASFVRASQREALMTRCANEIDPRTKETIVKHAGKALKLSAFTCAYIAHAGVDFAALYSSTRFNIDTDKNNAMFNEKAIPKAWYLASILNGGVFETDTNDGATLFCAVQAIATGHVTNFAIREYMRKQMCAWNKGNVPGMWQSEGTQTSSSVRALWGLGVIVPDASRSWKVNNAKLFQRCLDACEGIYADTDASADNETIPDDFDGVTIDGEVYHVDAETLAIAHAPHADAMTVVHHTATTFRPAPILPLSAPVSAPTKGRGKRKGR